MVIAIDAIASLSDSDLCGTLKQLAQDERDATTRLVAALGEMDRRRLFLAQGSPSLFWYCTRVLHLAGGAAYTRIEVARLANRWPIVLARLADGSINLTTARTLAAHLTDDNHRALLDAAAFKSKREVEEQVAALRPQPDVPSSVRKLPAPVAVAGGVGADRVERAPAAASAPSGASHRTGATVTSPPASLTDHVDAMTTSSAPPQRPAVVAPLAPERFKVQFTMSRESYDRLRHAQDLLRHVIPNGDPAAIFERALQLLVSELERKKLARVDRPRPASSVRARSRHVPAAVTREVWKRDGGRCAFVGPEGRCPERGFLEFHHVVPFADGGPTTSANLSLRCRAHNQHEARAVFGPRLDVDAIEDSSRDEPRVAAQVVAIDAPS